MNHDDDGNVSISPGHDPFPVLAMARRRFLKRTLCYAAGMLFPGSLRCAASGAADRRSLCLHRVYTGETLRVTYCTPTGYDTAALMAVSHLMRDRRTGGIKLIDERLLDYLFTVESMLNAPGPFNILSGYRSPETNALLLRDGNGAAINSYHLKGMAVDLWKPGVAIATLREAALEARAGGVGYYPDRHFVHLDVGPIRQWSIG